MLPNAYSELANWNGELFLPSSSPLHEPSSTPRPSLGRATLSNCHSSAPSPPQIEGRATTNKSTPGRNTFKYDPVTPLSELEANGDSEEVDRALILTSSMSTPISQIDEGVDDLDELALEDLVHTLEDESTTEIDSRESSHPRPSSQHRMEADQVPVFSLPLEIDDSCQQSEPNNLGLMSSVPPSEETPLIHILSQLHEPTETISSGSLGLSLVPTNTSGSTLNVNPSAGAGSLSIGPSSQTTSDLAHRGIRVKEPSLGTSSPVSSRKRILAELLDTTVVLNGPSSVRPTSGNSTANVASPTCRGDSAQTPVSSQLSEPTELPTLVEDVPTVDTTKSGRETSASDASTFVDLTIDVSPKVTILSRKPRTNKSSFTTLAQEQSSPLVMSSSMAPLTISSPTSEDSRMDVDSDPSLSFTPDTRMQNLPASSEPRSPGPVPGSSQPHKSAASKRRVNPAPKLKPLDQSRISSASRTRRRPREVSVISISSTDREPRRSQRRGASRQEPPRKKRKASRGNLAYVDIPPLPSGFKRQDYQPMSQLFALGHRRRRSSRKVVITDSSDPMTPAPVEPSPPPSPPPALPLSSPLSSPPLKRKLDDTSPDSRKKARVDIEHDGYDDDWCLEWDGEQGEDSLHFLKPVSVELSQWRPMSNAMVSFNLRHMRTIPFWTKIPPHPRFPWKGTTSSELPPHAMSPHVTHPSEKSIDQPPSASHSQTQFDALLSLPDDMEHVIAQTPTVASRFYNVSSHCSGDMSVPPVTGPSAARTNLSGSPGSITEDYVQYHQLFHISPSLNSDNNLGADREPWLGMDGHSTRFVDSEYDTVNGTIDPSLLNPILPTYSPPLSPLSSPPSHGVDPSLLFPGVPGLDGSPKGKGKGKAPDISPSSHHDAGPKASKQDSRRGRRKRIPSKRILDALSGDDLTDRDAEGSEVDEDSLEGEILAVYSSDGDHSAVASPRLEDGTEQEKPSQGSNLDFQALASEPTACHHCRRKTTLDKMRCTMTRHNGEVCGLRFCTNCIAKRYPHITFDPYPRRFICPRCSDTCNCSVCSRRRGEEYIPEKRGGLITYYETHTAPPQRKPMETSAPPAERPTRKTRNSKATKPPPPEELPATAASVKAAAASVATLQLPQGQFWGTVYGLHGERLGAGIIASGNTGIVLTATEKTDEARPRKPISVRYFVGEPRLIWGACKTTNPEPPPVSQRWFVGSWMPLLDKSYKSIDDHILALEKGSRESSPFSSLRSGSEASPAKPPSINVNDIGFVLAQALKASLDDA